MNISGNTIFIPGGTSGIGLGLALRLQAKGNTVIVGGRRAELLDEIRSQHAGIGTVVIDTTSPASIAQAYESVTSRYPQLDTLITMAGIMLPEDLATEGSLQVAEQTVETNLLGPIRLVYQFLPALQKGEKATIITVSSGLAYVPLPATPTYNATKAAIHSFTEGIRVQLEKSNVQVIELVPPAVRTTLMNQEESPIAMPLEEFLEEVMTLLEKAGDAEQILVERVKWQRNAVAEGRYQDVLGVLAGRYRS
ncbi:SDR family oxidoreductase [Streptomyces capillispiralis]|uniref:Short-subunit dehydrogenase involved in D-alanine esterification of teichoic acids n=1 Tax=Streptomyces capillispiralis TaxID=68182 RepID=A0A561TP52_9ACTN|nr:SDR family NAD(P)-dependent oxidoreductase [Streptomyces capillispiralis]TWF88909.1 short-subunit dehydrogenase involved in D-alanine esterification of teichoic acids [Streptomyces capillispiralis]GHH93176.1 oxidoreductase [Streptomyces capillispiralis]